MRIFTKILVMVVAAVVVSGLGVFWTAQFYMDQAFDREARSAIVSAQGVMSNYVDALKKSYLQSARLIASNTRLQDAVAGRDQAVLKAVAQAAMRESGADFLTVSDASGTVLVRAHADRVGDSVAGQANVRRALAGEAGVGVEPGSVVAFSLRAGCPIYAHGRLVGVVTVGRTLSDFSFVDEVKEITALDVTLFEGETRLATTIMKDGKRAVGTKMDNPQVLETVLSRKDRFLDSNVILGRAYETAYWPILNPDGEAVGMYFIGKPLDAILAAKQKIFVAVLAVSAVLIALMIGVGVIFALSLTRPLVRTTAFATELATGNLDATLAVRAQGEVGVLVEALKTMVAKLKEMIAESEEKTREANEKSRLAAEATREAENARHQAEVARKTGMLDAASNIEVIVERVTSAAEQLAAQIEQSSQGMEIQKERTTETSAAMEEMNASVLEVARNASSAASNADDAKHQAQTGAEVVRTVIASTNEVRDLAAHMKASLAKLGDQATGIGRIMNVINDIADQTNLLALNAAIEAARAGDAGRGFAVVADEVRKLAEKTMSATKEVGEAISGIQGRTTENITRMATTEESVQKSTGLAGEAGEALDRIVRHSEVTADQVRAIATASEEQSAASEQVSRSTEEVNRVAMETSEAMVQSAQAVADLARMAQELRALVDNMKNA